MKKVMIVILAGLLAGCGSVRETVCGGANSVGYLGGTCFALQVASDIFGSNSSHSDTVSSNTPPTLATPTLPATPATEAAPEKK